MSDNHDIFEAILGLMKVNGQITKNQTVIADLLRSIRAILIVLTIIISIVVLIFLT